ncbi:tRNA pseudouridine synthase B (plasmid) [Legionella adelaidensis]|uniref:tRNA pseudouridine synthase B n=1 Tax=Legionella adelaidensis TaxID=45056 RepID=A0A0W0R0F2_9GAMM|nr:tRNA pseudouridine(55) synthase TruB [Legionella adelaidensis]KTC64551.1 tRNA pseudouridine synthase B [Legionella adelaidensis]VEH85919.1 tRNA pseudouridine synthase B [Legionella adelaidensis]
MSKNEKLAINGILLVNKSYGKSSNAILQQVKWLYHAKKAGHTGSLDPMATGMLPICFGEATKFSQFLLDADKCYEATGVLGKTTNTGDAMGELVNEVTDFQVTKEDLLNALNQFKGETRQTPSMFSALKHKGKPLYTYARQGIEIEREARKIIIHKLELIEFHGKEFRVLIRCSKGTYVRNLIEDIGNNLGVGAHVSQLHRVYTAGFEDEKMYTVEELSTQAFEKLNTYLLPIDRAVRHLPEIKISPEQVITLQKGVPVQLKEVQLKGLVRLYNATSLEFIGIGEVGDTGKLVSKRLLSTSPELS